MLTKHITRGDITTSSSATYVMESRIVESFQRNEDIRGGEFSTMDRDIDAILAREFLLAAIDNAFRSRSRWRRSSERWA